MNYSDSINEVLKIQDLSILFIENNKDEVFLHGECRKVTNCYHCNSNAVERYKGKPKTIRHTNIFGKKCYLCFNHSSYRCLNCGLHFIQSLSFLTFTKHYTNQFIEEMIKIARGSSLSHASTLLKEPYTNIERLYYAYLIQADKKSLFSWQAKNIGIDEISMKKGHRTFILIIYDLDKGIVLDVLKDRKKATLKRYIQKIPKEVKDAIKSVCIDMWRPYKDCIKEMFPGVIIIVDRFHVAKELGKAIDKARQQLHKEDKFSELSGKERKMLFWAVRYSDKTLKKKSKYHKVLKKAMNLCSQLKLVIEIKREFKAIFDLKRPDIARKRISGWLRKVTRSKITPLVKFLKTFRNWRIWIMNFLPFRYTNAPAEGMNNKIKLIKRLGFGFDSFNNFRLRILHTCGALV